MKINPSPLSLSVVSVAGIRLGGRNLLKLKIQKLHNCPQFILNINMDAQILGHVFKASRLNWLFPAFCLVHFYYTFDSGSHGE